MHENYLHYFTNTSRGPVHKENDLIEALNSGRIALGYAVYYAIAAAAGADIVGSNCGNGIEAMLAIAEEFVRHTTLPVMIQSNAGLPELHDGHAVYAETPAFMADRIPRLLDLGVRIIGGCCGTTPEHIAAFRRVIDNHRRQ